MTREDFQAPSGNHLEVTTHSPSRVHAVLDDLRLASSTLLNVGTQCLDHQVTVGVIGWRLPLAADVLSPATSLSCNAHILSLTLGKNSLGVRGAAALAVGGQLASSVAAYEMAEAAAGFGMETLDRQVATIRLAAAVGYGVTRLQQGEGLSEAFTDSLEAIPGAAEGGPALVAGLGGGAGYHALVKVLGALGDDQASRGGPVTVKQKQAPGPHAAPAAHSIGHAAHRINDLHRGGSQATHIQAQRVVDAAGHGRWVVLVPGTQEFSSNRPNPADGTGILQSLAGHPSAMTGAVTKALESAQKAEGVYGRGEAVMLVGHSQGGMVAANMSRDPKVTQQFNIEKVATFGAPVTHMAPGTDELDVVNTRDLVPAGSGTDDGSDDDKRVRLRIDDKTSMTNSDGNREFAGAHDARNYGTDYDEAVTSSASDSALRNFDDASRPFFEGQARTYVFDAHREAPLPERR